VPLLFVLPARHRRLPAAVAEFVSLRDIAATIAGFVRPGTKSPFLGRSLLPVDPTGAMPGATALPTPSNGEDVVELSELASPNPSDPNHGRSPAYRGSLNSLAEGILSTSAMKATGARNYSTSATTPTNSPIALTLRTCCRS
jgi:hypothetical protein